MLVDFFQYLYTINNNDVAEYFNCYTTFLLTQKDLKDNVLHHRMKLLINYYVKDKITNKNKMEYYYYYLNNHKDNYFNKPMLKDEPMIEIKDDDKVDLYDDVKDHYKFITTPNPPKEIIDYDELDKKYYLEEEEKLNTENDCGDDDYYDDDYYDDYNEYEEIDEDEYYQ